MINENTRDPLLDLVGRLPKAEPGVTSTERVRARCHAVMEKQRQGRAEPPDRRAAWILLDATLVAGAFMYVAGAVAEAFRIIRTE